MQKYTSEAIKRILKDYDEKLNIVLTQENEEIKTYAITYKTETVTLLVTSFFIKESEYCTITQNELNYLMEEAKKIVKEQDIKEFKKSVQEFKEKEEEANKMKNIYDVKEFIKREAKELDDCYFEKDSDGDYYLTGEGVSELLDLAVHEFGFFDLVRIYQCNGLLEFEEAQKLLYDELFNNGVDWEEIESLIYYDDIIDKMEELDSEEINQVLFLELWKGTEV